MSKFDIESNACNMDLDRISKKAKMVVYEQGKKSFKEVHVLSNQTILLSNTVKEIFKPNRTQAVIILEGQNGYQIQVCAKAALAL